MLMHYSFAGNLRKMNLLRRIRSLVYAMPLYFCYRASLSTENSITLIKYRDACPPIVALLSVVEPLPFTTQFLDDDARVTMTAADISLIYFAIYI
jgi:hypothetical protein